MINNHPMSGLKGTDAGKKLMSDVRAHKGGAVPPPTNLPPASGAKAPAERDAKTRHQDAASGAAMGDGSYPIRNQTQLDDAVKDWIRTGRSLAVKSHIQKRAAALKLDLPASMGGAKPTDEMDVAKTIAARK